MLCGSAFKNKGVQPLLDAIVELLPSPLEVPPVTGLAAGKKGADEVDAESAEVVERPADEDAPFAALAFKVMADPYVGKLTYFRVYSGKVAAGGRVLNATTGRTERIGRLLMMHANHREEIEEAYAGDIVAGRRPQADLHRRHAVRPRRPGAAGDDRLPRAGDRGRDRAEDEGRPGEALGVARPARRGGPDLPGPDRRGDRPDADPRDGRASPRGDRRPPAARVQRRRQRRPPAGRLPRDDQGRGRRRSRAGSSARPAAAASSATSSSTSSRRPRRASTSSTRSRAARSRPSSSPPSSRGSRRRSAPASRPATRWSTCGSS